MQETLEPTVLLRIPALSLSGFFSSLVNQSLNGWGRLGAHTLPVCEAVLRNADALFVGRSDRVVKPDSLNEATVTTGALVSDNNIEKRACFCTATGESNDDHDLSFG
jgi:hypothetical protein